MQRFFTVFSLLSAAAVGQLHNGDGNCPLDLDHDHNLNSTRDDVIVPQPRAQSVSCNAGYYVTLQPGSSYLITSPNYPYSYPNNLDCDYNMEVPSESTVTLSCEQFSIYGQTTWSGSCSWNSDYFALIRDGSLYGVACGTELQNRYMTFTVSDWFRIAFWTNYSYRSRGFNCQVSIETSGSEPTTAAPTAAPTTAAPTTVAPTTAAPTAAPTTAAPVGDSDICQICGLTDGNRVVNGEDATVCEHPWQIRWEANGYMCGGTIVGHNTVITAAHCTDGMTASEMTVCVGGQEQYGFDGECFTPSEVIQHPDYDKDTTKNDITILKFDEDLLAATGGACSSPAPACLPASDANDEGVTADISGWGTTSSGGSVSSTLQTAVVDTISSTACNQYYGSSYNPSVEICASGTTATGQNVDTCQGDSGGPLVTDASGRATLIGVVSWGYSCAAGYPGVYARVSAYNDWISANAGSDVCFL